MNNSIRLISIFFWQKMCVLNWLVLKAFWNNFFSHFHSTNLTTSSQIYFPPNRHADWPIKIMRTFKTSHSNSHIFFALRSFCFTPKKYTQITWMAHENHCYFVFGIRCFFDGLEWRKKNKLYTKMTHFQQNAENPIDSFNTLIVSQKIESMKINNSTSCGYKFKIVAFVGQIDVSNSFHTRKT